MSSRRIFLNFQKKIIFTFFYLFLVFLFKSFWSQRFHSIVLSKSVFWPRSCFWSHFTDGNLTEFGFLRNALEFHLLIKINYSAWVNAMCSLNLAYIYKFSACCLNRENWFLILFGSLISSSEFSRSKFCKVMVHDMSFRYVKLIGSGKSKLASIMFYIFWMIK